MLGHTGTANPATASTSASTTAALPRRSRVDGATRPSLRAQIRHWDASSVVAFDSRSPADFEPSARSTAPGYEICSASPTARVTGSVAAHVSAEATPRTSHTSDFLPVPAGRNSTSPSSAAYSSVAASGAGPGRSEAT